MDPCEPSLSVSVLANAISFKCSLTDIQLPALVFTHLGDTLATIAFRRSQCEQCRQYARYAA